MYLEQYKMVLVFGGIGRGNPKTIGVPTNHVGLPRGEQTIEKERPILQQQNPQTTGNKHKSDAHSVQ